MAGLLKQLQKKKKVRTDEGADSVVITASEPSGDVLSTRELNRHVVEAENLLAELVGESAKALINEPERQDRQLRVVRRHRKSSKSTDEALAPSWSKDERKFSTEAQNLLAAASTAILEEVLTLPAQGDKLEAAIRESVEKCATKVRDRVTRREIDIVCKELFSLLTTKGPLQQLYDDNLVTEIFIDNSSAIKVTRKGKVLDIPFSFHGAEEYRLFVAGLLRHGGQRLDRSNPIVESVLNDSWQSRVSVIDGSIAGGEEPKVCIRIPRLQKNSFYDLLQTKVLPATLAAWLAEVVSQGEMNILIVGANGAGKTLLTAALLNEMNSEERIITIEEIPELSSNSQQLEKLVGRPADSEGNGGISLAQLVSVALRRNPKRIVMGDLQDDEAAAYLKALERGVSGSIASMHADFAEDGLWRFLDAVSMHERSPQDSLIRRVSRSIHLVIALQRVEDKPCVTEVVEVEPTLGGNFLVHPLVRFVGLQDGKRIWKIVKDNTYWLKRVAERGVSLKSGPGLLGPDMPQADKTQTDKKDKRDKGER